MTSELISGEQVPIQEISMSKDPVMQKINTNQITQALHQGAFAPTPEASE